MEFRHTVEIAAPPETVLAFLADLEHHRDLHPLIESIAEVDPPGDRPDARAHDIVDLVPIGPFRVRTTYRAVVERNGTDRVVAEAWQRPRVHLRTTYTATATAGGTHLSEHVRITAPFGLRRFVVRQARNAHAATMRALPGVMERR